MNYWTTRKLAVDRLPSVRSIDRDGRLRIAETVITMEAVNEYAGSELDDGTLDPRRMYRIWRPGSEIVKAAPTLGGCPLTDEHIQVSAEKPQRGRVVGAVMNDIRWSPPYLTASIIVWDSEAIDAVESGEASSLSAGYHRCVSLVPGTYNGQRYDGSMSELTFNHVALVSAGRIGVSAELAEDKLWGFRQRFLGAA